MYQWGYPKTVLLPLCDPLLLSTVQRLVLLVLKETAPCTLKPYYECVSTIGPSLPNRMYLRSTPGSFVFNTGLIFFDKKHTEEHTLVHPNTLLKIIEKLPNSHRALTPLPPRTHALHSSSSSASNCATILGSLPPARAFLFSLSLIHI